MQVTCYVCDGQRFCLCQRLLKAPPTPEHKPMTCMMCDQAAPACLCKSPMWALPTPPRGSAPIDHALDDVQRLMDETRIRKEALRMANALVKLLEGSK